jgi:hypothetical protein
VDITVRSESFGVENRSWLGSAHGTEATRTVTLDVSAFTEGTHYPDGYIKSGTVLGRITSSGLYGPYGGSSNEVQTIGLGSASAGTVTITFDGETTAAIAYNATASAVQTALLLLSNLNTGDVVVTGTAFPGVLTLTFGGQYAGQNVPEITATPSGLTGGTVTIATTTQGGSGVSNGLETAAGFLFNSTKVGTADVGAPMLEHGMVVQANLPANSGYDSAAGTDMAGRIVVR